MLIYRFIHALFHLFIRFFESRLELYRLEKIPVSASASVFHIPRVNFTRVASVGILWRRDVSAVMSEINEYVDQAYEHRDLSRFITETKKK